MASGPVTVFGGTGFLGSQIVLELVEAGCAVRIVARRPTWPNWAEPDDPLSLVEADICSESDTRQALHGAAGVVNAVSLYTESRQLRFEHLHVEAAAQLARLAHRQGITTLIQLSGIGADPASRSPYIRARGRGEVAVIEAFPKAVILRPSVMFGPHDRFLFTLERLTRHRVLPLFGKGETLLQPVHVRDVARACHRLLNATTTQRRLFELGGADVLRYRDILGLIAAHLERDPRMVPVPFRLWQLAALLGSWLPSPPLTRDQLALMRQHNVVDPSLGTLADLGITPRSLRESLPDCLPCR